MNIQEWIQKQKEITEKAEREGRRALTEEEQREFDALQAQIDAARKENGAKAQAPAAHQDPQPGQSGEEALQKERERAAEITSLCRAFGLDASPYIQDGSTVDAVRAAVLEQLKKDKAPLSVSVQDSGEDRYREDAANGLMLRAGLPVEEGKGGESFRAMSIRDLAVDCLGRAGQGGAHRMSNDDLYAELCRQFFNPTAAFPSILDQTIRKSYVAGYNQAAVTFDKWTSRGTLADFKLTTASYLAGAAGELLLVPETGELKADLPGDHLTPTRKLNTYGRQFSMSRQAFINDDIGYLTTIPSRYAASARKTINKQVYSVLTGNPVIYDGVALFDETNHKNLISTGTDLTAEAIQTAMLKLQLQTDQDGNAILIRPAYLVVPVGYAMKAYTILNSATINTPENTQAVNPLQQFALTVVEDATLNVLSGTEALPWFLVGAASDVKSIQVDYLNGQEIPTIRRMEKPGQLGFLWDIYLDWGVSVIDYRGIVKNNGVKLSL